MTLVTPCSIGNIHVFPIKTFTSTKENRLTKCNFPGTAKPKLPSQRFLLPQPISLRLFSKYKSGSGIQYRPRIQISAAIGTDVAIEEPSSTVEGGDADKASEMSPSIGETSEPSSTRDASVASTSQSKRPRPIRKSDMPPVKNEELLPGATFTGKVRSIQPFGAFVDFGAFTDGLVHVSRMSDSFVKDVNDIVSVGQEVKVTLVEANIETGRISLTMRESSDTSMFKDAPPNGDKPRPARKNAPKPNQKRDEIQKSSKFVKGQVLDGIVKNTTRAGAFISLPDGEEGFLPTSEESEGFGGIMGSSALTIGQEVNVRLLRVTRGKVTLTMKKEEDVDGLNSRLNQGVVHVATNPFFLAFRQNEAISAFLEEREKLQKSAKTLSVSKTSEKIEGTFGQTKTESDTLEVVDKEVETTLGPTVDNDISSKLAINEVIPESTAADSPQNAFVAIETVEENKMNSKTSISEDNESSASMVIDEAPVTDGVKEDTNKTASPCETGDQISSESMVTEEVVVSQADDTLVNDKVEAEKTSLTEEKISSTGVNTVIDESPIADETGDQISTSENVTNEETISSALDNDKVETEVLQVVENEMPSTVSEKDSKEEPSIPKQNGSVSANGQTVIPSLQESTARATVSAALVKHLHEETGAGMMDCKKALAETGGDLVKAQEFLRKKGLASAEKKASRATAEGRIGSYVHDNRIGVLIEVNCETDFVSRGDIFKQLVDDLAMQVAACPQVQYLITDDVPEDIVDKEREIEMQKEDLLKKPEQIRSKIVEGRIRKRLEEFALLEQSYIKNDKLVVKDWVKQTISTIGENIKVKRFVRYNLGEGLEKKSQDFAAEVAAQTAAKASPAVSKDQSPVEAKEAIEKPPTVAISAALVKQLREETGAGMMDCKKALSETGGDLEKAQEYLRKKGLSTADKKSSRLAAEGRIGSYIHDSRNGVLIEVNCETDFVGRSKKFQELVDNLAMQVVACPQVHYISVEEIPEEIVRKERELEMQREDLQSKPENIRAKIVDGRISKRLGELTLLEQPFIKDDSVLVKDLVKQMVAALGENIRVRRFVRFTLGEVTEDAEIEANA
ncbi:polyprotein of EF-Ts, chloroplastic-like isoform X2 [Tasmannia lanceolata]|uniref:polyprotein of EF-Ts, chloroplastic-like isoform X2 n=1 Tax=Tasmannia lanceolata TaxID=3420 RepID=UPI004062F2A1